MKRKRESCVLSLTIPTACIFWNDGGRKIPEERRREPTNDYRWKEEKKKREEEEKENEMKINLMNSQCNSSWKWGHWRSCLPILDDCLFPKKTMPEKKATPFNQPRHDHYLFIPNWPFPIPTTTQKKKKKTQKYREEEKEEKPPVPLSHLIEKRRKQWPVTRTSSI